MAMLPPRMCASQEEKPALKSKPTSRASTGSAGQPTHRGCFKKADFSTPAPLCHPLKVASASQLQLPSHGQAGHNEGSLQIFRDFKCLELFCEFALNTAGFFSYSTINTHFF